MLCGVVISSQAANITQASEEAIFGTAAESAKLIELSAFGQIQNQGDTAIRFFGGDTTYTESDLDAIEAIEHVTNAALAVPVPVDQMVTTDLFDDKKVLLTDVRSLDATVASQYTDQDFSYTPGQPIPIIINAQTLMTQYEDWQGKDEITITITRGNPGEGIDAMRNQSPIKIEALTYNADDLLDKEFTINVGGLAELQTYEQEFTGTGMLFRKLSTEAIQEKEDGQKEAIEPYWDYIAIQQPLSYTFKVVGVIESDSNRSTYLPSAFVDQLMQDYVQHQLDARTDTAVSTDLLNSTFTGMVYDGLELQTTSLFGGAGFRVMGGPGPEGAVSSSVSAAGLANDNAAADSYAIPGLVIETERTEGDSDEFSKRMMGTASDAIGIYDDPTVFTQATQSADTALITVDDVQNRAAVVEGLNAGGYAYQDTNDLEVFSELQATLHTVTTVATISFAILSAIIVILTMGKFVSESTKEIGVFRALGATKADIKQLFMSQAILYTLVGYVIGAIVGIGLVYIVAKPVQLWFDSFIADTVEETFSVVQKTSAGVFTQIDWSMFGLYSVLLLVIAIIISIVPATRASRVSPVQAIKND